MLNVIYLNCVTHLVHMRTANCDEQTLTMKKLDKLTLSLQILFNPKMMIQMMNRALHIVNANFQATKLASLSTLMHLQSHPTF